MELVQPIRSIEKIEEIKTVLKETGTRNFLLFTMGINTGLRISDLGHAEFLKMIGLVTILEKNDYDFIKARSYIECETLKPLPTSFMSGMRGILQRYIACYKPTTIQILEALLAVLPY